MFVTICRFKYQGIQIQEHYEHFLQSSVVL